MKTLPVLNVEIDENDGFYIDAVALVHTPAIMSNFIALSKQDNPRATLMLSSDERMELLGAALIPEQLVYRRDKETGEEYYIKFSADTIRKAAMAFMKKGHQVDLNIEHTDKTAKSYIFQSYIVDPGKGLNSPPGLDLPDGTWILGTKVEDADIWGSVKAGNVNGYSIQGNLLFSRVPKENNTNFDQLLSIFNQLNKNLTCLD